MNAPNPESVTDIVRLSNTTTHSPMERELIVRKKDKKKILKILKKSKDYSIIGVGLGPNKKTARIWFVYKQFLPFYNVETVEASSP